MTVIDRLKDLLSSDEGGGVVYECASCGAEFDTARETCPECGAAEIVERDAFELRPDQ